MDPFAQQDIGEELRNIIVYVGAFELPDKNAAAHRVLANAKLLKSLGYEVVLIGRTSASSAQPGTLKPTKFDGIDHQCWELQYPTSGREWLSYISSSKAIDALISEEFANRLHSVICYNYPAIAQLRLRSFARRLGALGLADVTEWNQHLHVRGVKSLIKNFDTIFRMKFVNFQMDGLITTSRFLTRYYSKKYNNLVELPTLIELHKDFAIEVSPDGAPKRLFFAGAIQDKRSIAKEVGGLKDRLNWVIELLGNADEQGADFRLDIFGVGKQEYLEFFSEHTALLDTMGGKVAFHGRKSHSHILENLVKADFSIFMRPDMVTTNAGFPTKFSESIAYGTPVITNPIDCLVPYLKDGENSIVIDHQAGTGNVTKVIRAMLMSEAEVMNMKRYCLASEAFHPLSFRGEAQKLFPELKKVPS